MIDKKRWFKICAAVMAVVMIVGLSVYAIILDHERASLRQQVTNNYNRAFEGLIADVASLETKLYKLDAARGTNQCAMLLVDVWRQTGDTESAIAALPVSFAGTSPLMQFVCRTGDYCHSLSGKLARGEEISDEEYEQIRQLAKACSEAYKSIESSWQQGYPGDIAFDQTAVFLPDEQLGGNLDFSNQQFPRLMYDGPFSEGTENKKPEGLGSKQVTEKEAAQAAAKFLGVDAGTLRFDGEVNGTIAGYSFTGEANGKAFSICVTKQGGQVLWYRSDSDGGISAVPTDEKYHALTKVAQQYLKDKGFGESEPSYAQFYNGTAVINLAPVENDIVLYPDLIKIWVDIAGGQVVGFEAQNYLTSHKKRDFEQPELTALQAQKTVTSELLVSNVRLALIPLETNEEKLCWEFTGSIGERDYIVYVNAKTGVEEDVLMIQHTNDGTLVM